MLLGAMHSDRAHSRSQDRYRLIIPCCVVMATRPCALRPLHLSVHRSVRTGLASNLLLRDAGPVLGTPIQLLQGPVRGRLHRRRQYPRHHRRLHRPLLDGASAKDLTGNYQRGLLTLSVPMLCSRRNHALHAPCNAPQIR